VGVVVEEANVVVVAVVPPVVVEATIDTPLPHPESNASVEIRTAGMNMHLNRVVERITSPEALDSNLLP
jgi:hypothetical protein